MRYYEMLKEDFIDGERVQHKEQQSYKTGQLRTGTVKGYEGNETAVEFDDEPGEIYFVPNDDLVLIENATAGASSAGSVATVVGGLGAGFDPDADWRSIYPSNKKKDKMAIIRRPSVIPAK